MRYIQNCEWEESCISAPTKNEWGVDTLQREFRGRADKHENFLRTLSQGQVFTYGGGAYHLQTWSSDNHRTFPTVFLYYKGLANGRLPNSELSDGTSLKSASKTQTASGTLPERTYEIQYISPTATLRYISNVRGYGTAPVISVALPVIIQSFWVDDTFKKRSGYPSGLSIKAIIETRNQNPIHGTPFFETEMTASGIIEP